MNEWAIESLKIIMFEDDNWLRTPGDDPVLGLRLRELRRLSHPRLKIGVPVLSERCGRPWARGSLPPPAVGGKSEALVPRVFKRALPSKAWVL